MREGEEGSAEASGVHVYAMIVPMSSMSRVLMPVMLVLMSMSRQNLGYS